jgi:hypothetical protein
MSQLGRGQSGNRNQANLLEPSVAPALKTFQTNTYQNLAMGKGQNQNAVHLKLSGVEIQRGRRWVRVGTFAHVGRFAPFPTA